MIILPLGHDAYVQKLPYVTFGLIAVNILVFMFTSQIAPGRDLVHSQAKQEYESYLNMMYNRYAIEIEKDLELTGKDIPVIEKVHKIEDEIKNRLDRRKFKDLTDQDYQEWEDIKQKFRSTKEKNIFQKYGFVPGDIHWYSLITSLFLHGGILHLIGNMLFLYLTGSAIEERWGSVAFTAIYLLSGIAASFSHALENMDSMVPCIGASGAIAGLMGIFLIRFSNARIRFFYLYFFSLIPRHGFFTATAKIMLPLWLLLQLFYTFIGSEYLGIALWAHIGGFAFGVLVALFIRLFHLEPKLYQVTEQIGSTRFKVSPRLIEAHKLFDDGNPNAAIALYQKILEANPHDYDANNSILQAYISIGQPDRAVPHVEWLLRYYQEKKMSDEILDFSMNFRQQYPELYLGSRSHFIIAKTMEERSEWEYANAEYNEIIKKEKDEGTKNRAIYQKALIFRDKLGKPDKALLLFRLLKTKDTSLKWKEVLDLDIQQAQK